MRQVREIQQARGCRRPDKTQNLPQSPWKERSPANSSTLTSRVVREGTSAVVSPTFMVIG